jgi:hypothetical protein
MQILMEGNRILLFASTKLATRSYLQTLHHISYASKEISQRIFYRHNRVILTKHIIHDRKRKQMI